MEFNTTLAAIRAADLFVVALYLVAMAAFAVIWGRRNVDTEGYFLGGRNMPGWAVGLSLIGTSISSVSFLAIPAAAFALDWRLLMRDYSIIVAGVIAICVFVPLFRAMNYTTANEFLEKRLGRFSRLYCAIIFILTQLLRLGVVLYLVSEPIAMLLGAEVFWVIVLGGLFILLYTVFGGIEVVIWTDVVQTIVLWGGAIVILVYVFMEMPDGFGGVERAYDAGKFHVGAFDWDMTRRTFWTLVVVGAFASIGDYASNQNIVQRYIATRTTRDARIAVVIAVVFSICTWTFFYFVGTSLWSLYTALPEDTLADLVPEKVVAHFTVHFLPTGVTGLIVAAVMAASMSSLDSSINAVSTVTTTDIVRRYLAKGRSERVYLRWAKGISAVTGLLMILLALWIWVTPRESIIDLTQQLTSIAGGVVPGIFIMAIFIRRVSPKALLMAIPFAIGYNIYAAIAYSPWGKENLPAGLIPTIHIYWVSFVANMILMVLAIAFSFIWPRRPEPPVDPVMEVA